MVAVDRSLNAAAILQTLHEARGKEALRDSAFAVFDDEVDLFVYMVVRRWSGVARVGDARSAGARPVPVASRHAVLRPAFVAAEAAPQLGRQHLVEMHSDCGTNEVTDAMARFSAWH